MGQEYFINSQELQDKVSNLLPSQGGAGAGFDLSASTQIIPIIDLTESAEGSNVREDLQTAMSFTSITSFAVLNSTTDIISNTGYYRVFGGLTGNPANNALGCQLQLTDGVTTKVIIDGRLALPITSAGFAPILPFDFVIKLEAGEILQAKSDATTIGLRGSTRQIADIDGNLTNP